MNKLINPFIDDSVVKGKDYCSRIDIEEKILIKLNSGHNLVLIGDRRIGKTSTAHYVVDHIKKSYKIDIDLFHVADASDIAETIMNACQKVLNQVWDSKKILDFAGRLRPELEISPDGFSLGIGVGRDDEYKKTLNVAFEFIEETIKRTKKDIVVLFDEFQAIKEIKNGDAVLKYMRGKIQKLSRISFMYVGSIRHEMDHIFRDQNSPFYKQAEIIYFDHIEPEIFYKFISKKFKKKNIVLNKDVYDYLYNICNGITADIQTFCRVAFDSLDEKTTIDFATYFFIVDIIYKNESKYFKNVLDGKELTKVQKKLLTQLAGVSVSEDIKIFSKEFQKVIGVKSPGAVTNAISALEKKGYIYKTEKFYYFSNPFFKEWIQDFRYFIKVNAGIIKSGTRLEFGYRERLMGNIR